MRNYIIILLSIYLLISATVSYTQQSMNTNKSQGFVQHNVFSIGAGTTLNETSFILAPNISWELHEHINIGTGVDLYFKKKNSYIFSTINIIPYYVLRPSKKTMFQAGLGGMVYNKSILPVFSTKFDYQISAKNYLGLQFKSYVTNITEGPTYLLLLVNYSIRF